MYLAIIVFFHIFWKIAIYIYFMIQTTIDYLANWLSWVIYWLVYVKPQLWTIVNWWTGLVANEGKGGREVWTNKCFIAIQKNYSEAFLSKCDSYYYFYKLWINEKQFPDLIFKPLNLETNYLCYNKQSYSLFEKGEHAADYWLL